MHEARKILVPVNFSEKSGSGLEYAVSLAEETQAELVVLHVAKKSEAEAFLDLLAIMEGSPVLNPPPAIPVDRLLREKALDLHRFVERVVRKPRRLKISRKIALGDKEEKILEIVKDESIELVVLPVRKRSFFPYLRVEQSC